MGRIVDGMAGLLGILFAGMGLRWLVDPSASAAGLGMPLLEGVGLSTQIGDFTSFFLVGGSGALVALIRRDASLLVMAGALFGGAAVFRTLAWLLHGAAFAPAPIAVEVITFVVMLLAARRAAAMTGQPVS